MPNPLKLKEFENVSVLPNVHRQRVECLAKIDDIPALFQMTFQQLKPMKRTTFENKAKKLSTNLKSSIEEIEDTVWKSLSLRATTKTSNTYLFITFSLICIIFQSHLVRIFINSFENRYQLASNLCSRFVGKYY